MGCAPASFNWTLYVRVDNPLAQFSRSFFTGNVGKFNTTIQISSVVHDVIASFRIYSWHYIVHIIPFAWEK